MLLMFCCNTEYKAYFCISKVEPQIGQSLLTDINLIQILRTSWRALHTKADPSVDVQMSVKRHKILNAGFRAKKTFSTWKIYTMKL